MPPVSADDPTAPPLLLVTIPDGDAVATVEDNVQKAVAVTDAGTGDAVPREGGPMLTPVGQGRYLLAAPAAKAIALSLEGTGWGSVAQWLAGQAGVTRAVAVDLADAKALLRVLDPSEARRPPAEAVDEDKQWNLKTVRAPDAWQKFERSQDRPWRDVLIGHLDTGYTRHDVFRFDDAGNSPIVRTDLGQDVLDGDPDPRDPVQEDYPGHPGHGTRTGGTLAGDLEDTFLGVAPGASLVPFRVTRSVIVNAPLGSRDARLDLGFQAAVDVGCRVISVSLGDNAFPARAVGRAVDHAYEKGVIICAAAGNYIGPVVYPALYLRTIGVGGITRDEYTWWGSCRGTSLDISAPAANLYRPTTELRNGRLNRSLYGDGGDGTSYATVHVAAAAALWLSHHGPRITTMYGRTWRVVEAFRDVIRATARPIKTRMADQFGAGILDIAAALDAQLPDPDALVYEDIKAEGQRWG